MNKPKTPAQQAYDDRRATEKARKAQIKAETDAAFADEDAAQVTNNTPSADKAAERKAAREKKAEESAAAAMQKKAEREAAVSEKKDHEAKVKAQRAAEKTQRIQDEKDRQARLVIDKAQKKAAKEKSKADKLAERAKAKAEREANKVPRRHTEASLVAKWGARIVPGSLHYETEGKYAGKQTVEIRTCTLVEGLDGSLNTTHEDIGGADADEQERCFDGNTRRIATSDLFQVFYTDENLAKLRRYRSKLSRAARKIASA